jgi:UPF0755 protein
MSSKNRRKTALLVLLFLTLLAFGLFRWIRAPFHGFAGPGVTVEFPIGTSTSRIFRELSHAGVVRSAPLAEAYYRIFHRDQPLLAGEYAFTGSETLDGVIGRIAAGEVVKHAVVVPEGLTGAETFVLFLDQRIGTPRGFLRAFGETGLLPWPVPEGTDLEGFLFPDTYVVTRSTSTREILTRMAENFGRHFTAAMKERAQAMNLSVWQAVTLASLVEKETSLPQERPRIAAVYLNRLQRGMRLQCDPSVIYALQREGKWTGRLHRSDLDFDSVYNTYLHYGLPPGPICNPGAASLAAAVGPSDVPDLYFVARGDGGHYFSRTYEDHLRMVARSRRNSAADEEPR